MNETSGPTENSLRDEDLTAAPQRLNHAERVARLGSWEHDLDADHLSWSDEVYRIFGVDPANFGNTYEAFYALVHPADRARLLAERNRGLEREGCFALDHRIVRPDGQIRHVHERAEILEREDGRRVVTGIVQDITERREAEEKLRRSEALLRIAGRVARLGGWSLELPSARLLWSDEVCEIHDVPAGTSPTLLEAFEYYAPQWRRAFADAVIRCMREGVPFDLEAELVTAKGRRIWVRSIGEAERDSEGAICRLQGAVQDITELRESQARRNQLLEVVESSLNEIYVFDPKSLRFLYVNEGACRNLGYSREELLRLTPPDLKTEFSEASFREMIRPLVLGHKAKLVFETLHRRADGSVYPTEVHLQYVGNLQNPVFLAVINDITERQRAEEKTRDIAAHLQGLLDNSPLYISEFDLDGRYLLISRTVCELLGRETDEIVGRTLHEMIGSKIAERYLQLGMEVAESREPLNFKDRFPVENLERHFSTILFPLFGPKGEVTSIGSITRDITQQERHAQEREKLEVQLRQAQKMEAVGRLAGGVAHDFNNMLSVILGHAELALDELGENDPLRESIGEIAEAGHQSAGLTRQLLAFARKQTIAPEIINLNDSVERSMKLLGRLIGEDIELVWRPAADLWPVRIDPAQVDQILANLAVNARDAIEGVGRIALETSNVRLNEEDVQGLPGFVPGAYVLLSFSDTGCGMDADTHNQIFEPFFTTKETGRGTGLGLATVYGILKQNQGFVYVDSKPGEGSTFRIYLPPHLSDETPGSSRSARVEAPRGRGTILLVEDEAPLMRLTSRLIRELGYDVIEAASPQEALRRSAEHEGEFDLLLTDVVMPDMSGRDLWTELQRRRPGLKCLFMSGYTADIIAEHGVLHEGIYFLQKPFTRRTLAEKLRKAVAES